MGLRLLTSGRSKDLCGVAKQLFDTGGLHFNGVRWFVDHVGRKPEGKLVWIRWKASERRSDYAQRVRRESNGRSLHD